MLFNNYKNLLEKIASSIFDKSGETASFIEYLSVVGLSLLFAAIIAFAVLLVIISAAGPVFFHKKLFRGIKERKEKFNKDSDVKEYEEIKKLSRNRNIVFWSSFVFLYLPISIPTVLYVVSVVVGLFA